MKTKSLLKSSFICASMLLLLGAVGCNQKDDGPEQVSNSFNRKEMLSNVANNIIKPHYAHYQNQIFALESALNTLGQTPSETHLSQLQEAFKNAYKAWQYVSVYEFGPAADLILRVNTNTFPTDTALVKSNIRGGDFNLGFASNTAAKGLPALDFLLHQPGKNTANLAMELGAKNNIAYLKALVADLRNNISTVVLRWDVYANTFIENDGNSVGSSLGLLVNQFNFDFELMKNYQIGTPLGKRTLGNPLPNRCEAFYAGYSMELINEHFTALSQLYQGVSKSGLNGKGLEDNLIALKSNYNESTLVTAITNQINDIDLKSKNVPDPLAATIISNPSVVNEFYAAVQKQVVLFKTDMPSALGVLITYQDNDGD